MAFLKQREQQAPTAKCILLKHYAHIPSYRHFHPSVRPSFVKPPLICTFFPVPWPYIFNYSAAFLNLFIHLFYLQSFIHSSLCILFFVIHPHIHPSIHPPIADLIIYHIYPSISPLFCPSSSFFSLFRNRFFHVASSHQCVQLFLICCRTFLFIREKDVLPIMAGEKRKRWEETRGAVTRGVNRGNERGGERRREAGEQFCCLNLFSSLAVID